MKNSVWKNIWKKRKWPKQIFLTCIMLSLLMATATGCSRLPILSHKDKTCLYYVNPEKTGLVEEEYDLQGSTALEQAKQILTELKQTPDKEKMQPSIPKGVEVKDVKLSGKKLTVDLSEEYLKLDTIQSVLLRAAVVESIVQVSGIRMVGFTVGKEPIQDENGDAIGYLNQDNFVQNSGSALHSYQDATLKLYFSNETGDALKEETVTVKYSSNVSMEKLIVEQILKGPSQSGEYPTLNPDTKVLGVTVKEGICYVNLDENFLNVTYDVTPEVAIYSLVNSLIEGTDASKVQISVNGETKVSYMDSLDLSEPLKMNGNLVQ